MTVKELINVLSLGVEHGVNEDSEVWLSVHMKDMDLYVDGAAQCVLKNDNEVVIVSE